MTPTGNRIIDTVLYVAGSAIAFNVILPIFALIFFVVFFIFYSGYQSSQSLNLLEMLANAETGFSLFWGGVCAMIVSVLISWNRLELREYSLIIKDGFLSMLPANLILIFA